MNNQDKTSKAIEELESLIKADERYIEECQDLNDFCPYKVVEITYQIKKGREYINVLKSIDFSDKK